MSKNCEPVKDKAERLVEDFPTAGIKCHGRSCIRMMMADCGVRCRLLFHPLTLDRLRLVGALHGVNQESIGPRQPHFSQNVIGHVLGI